MKRWEEKCITVVMVLEVGGHFVFSDRFKLYNCDSTWIDSGHVLVLRFSSPSQMTATKQQAIGK